MQNSRIYTRDYSVRCYQQPDLGCMGSEVCRQDRDHNAPLPLCTYHLREAFVYVLGTLADVDGGEAPKHLAKVVFTGGQRADGWVYFIRKGDEIKIGWTRNPVTRFQALQPDEVLHLQPGAMEDEHRCHVAFAHLREHGEWFRSEPDLVRFIDDLRAAA